jgi:hypothetical protein
MKKTAILMSFLLASQAILPLQSYRTKSSGTIPVDVDLQDVTAIYCDVDPSLHYYKISVRNCSLDYKVTLPHQTIASLGYQKADSQEWSNNFWMPFYWYEGTMLGATLLAAAGNANKKTLTITTGLALLGLIVQLGFRHNKVADLHASMIVSEAYNKITTGPTQSYKIPGIFVDEIKITHPGLTTLKKINSSDFIVFSTARPLNDILIDIYQMGTCYVISLTAE